mmetsp:Transcript_38689/g.97250  ORF Transcript_38689/g.97250 Transcript_38689/m.97250 type:complete len:265 (+) Transcript_38689:1748-2542(+)|eukprot:CAMPEP_0115637902 /NCGR_PEP_ID=MMETSP0272-20121206/34439_1 /TAXON_ID=71861 /ORGANISM="Scrippsiella trochoidea, Strain CCMP3099" /LENGTH=264 /DNA_ID=CAMNT_0003074983 /DNA_START=529 /DNA_END=1323 /DNA_ORIENTATION=-
MVAKINPTCAPATAAILIQNASHLVNAHLVRLRIRVSASAPATGCYQILITFWAQTAQDVARVPRRGRVVQALGRWVFCNARALFVDTITRAPLTRKLPFKLRTKTAAIRNDLLCPVPGHWHLKIRDVWAPTRDREPIVGCAVRPTGILLLLHAYKSTMRLDQGLGQWVGSFATVKSHKRAKVDLSDNAAVRDDAARVFHLEANFRKGIDAVLSLVPLAISNDVLRDNLCVEILGHAIHTRKIHILKRPLVDALRLHCTVEINV